MTTRLLIFAKSNLHRSAWQALLGTQPGIRVEGAAGELAQLDSFLLPSPAAVLVDVPSAHPDWARELRAALTQAGLLFLVESNDLNETIALLRAGATGLISRDSTVGDLARAIIAVGRGEIVLPEGLATRALLALAQGKVNQGRPSDNLTEREQEVLTYLAQGHTNKDIAQLLFLSVRTVEAHLHNIYGKLSVTSRTEAALWAVNNGYGPTD